MHTVNTYNNGKEQGTIFRLKPYTVKEFCYMYDTTGNTFRRWIGPFINEIGPRNGRYYSVLQVRIILNRLGTPVNIIVNASNFESLTG